jgi:hypothetical protein
MTEQSDEEGRDPGGSGELFHQHAKVVRDQVQIGWRNVDTGIMCDCPVYETSPHATSEPVMVDRDVLDRARQFDTGR